MNIKPAHANFATVRQASRKKSPATPASNAGFGPFDYEDLERQFLLVEERHAERLTSAAAQALREARYLDAFMYADRRCRIKPIAGAPEYLLRAGALSRLGELELARSDLTTALEIDPNHILANLTAMRAASGKDKLSFATAVIQNDTSSAATDEAIKAVGAAGYSAVGVFKATPDKIAGWLAWKGDAKLRLTLSDDSASHTLTVTADPAHPMARVLGYAANISVVWPATATYLAIDLPAQQGLIVNSTLLRPQSIPEPRPYIQRSLSTKTASPAPVAVIIPVYGDHDATKRCLEALTGDNRSPAGTRFIVVNDASPDKRLHALVQAFAREPHVTVLNHRTNLGFARSINDALATLKNEDVILLNADTVVPPGSISRLAKAAYSASNIGTVTPFSNNGEYTSFPIPFRENPLPTSDEIIAIDQIAATENAGQITDLPNGTAFCMYVTRSCLDAIGPLSTNFGKGYYEDVEFCLRAAAAGYRNVCATDVYVGHAGSKSFGKSKRALVARNLATLEAAYPSYRAISAGFMDSDPLLSARQAIEGATLGKCTATHRLIVAHNPDEALVAHRCKEFAGGDQRVLVASAQFGAGRIVMRISAADGGIPQNMHCEFPLNATPTLISAQLEKLRVVHAEILDLDETPSAIVNAILGDEISVSLFIPSDRAEIPADPKLQLASRPSDDEDIDSLWRFAISRADALLVTDEPTKHRFSKRFRSEKTISSIYQSKVPALSPPPLVPRNQECRLGIIGGSDATKQALIAQLASNASPRLHCDAVFFGATFDDLRLMASGRIFCTGEIESSDLKRTIRLYGTSHLLILDGRCVITSEANELPVARLDPGTDKIVSTDSTLIIPSGASVPTIADALNRWMQFSETAHG